MPSFPSSLPGPLLPGYSMEPVDPVARTDMEVGAPRSRRRTRARNDQVSCTWGFTDAQMAVFRAWFDDDATGISGGASWFSIVLDVGTGSAVSVEARFVGIFKATKPAALHWDVSAKLEVR